MKSITYLLPVVSALFLSLPIFAEDENSTTEDPVITAAVVSEPEIIVKGSAEHNLNISIRNNHQGTSALVVEVRKGGCDGEMIARFPLAVNDTVSYNCSADYVRIVPDIPDASKYSYSVGFNGSATGVTSRTFDASGKNKISVYCSNRNSSSKAPVVFTSKTNEGIENAEIDVEPTTYCYINDIADAVAIETAAETKGTSYRVTFSSR